jgi:DNA ligase-1
MKLLPTLYKKTSTGAIQQWSIDVIGQRGSNDAACIVTEHGQVEGKLQTTSDLISEGKNIGKANETTPREQAVAEATAKWEKQLKKGYVASVEAAQDDELDALIEGGIVPMLAHTFAKQGHKIKYPCYVQPKLDGIRCIAILKNGKATLWSRTRKPITSCPHIILEIENLFKDKTVVLDGELYNHSYKANFEHIVHLVRQEEPDPQHMDVEFHVYDIPNDQTFEERFKLLFRDLNTSKKKYLKMVETLRVLTEEDVPDLYSRFKNEGFEGAMLRNADGLYVNKRSYDLIKVKEMQDQEFEIIGIEEGRGKLAGHVGAFICHIDNPTSDIKQFKAKMAGNTERLKEYFENHGLWKGRLLTVQFQDLTSYGIPRFPVGLRIREDL